LPVFLGSESYLSAKDELQNKNVLHSQRHEITTTREKVCGLETNVYELIDNFLSKKQFLLFVGACATNLNCFGDRLLSYKN